MSAVPTSDVLITLLAEPAYTGPDFGKASPVGLFVILLLLIGVFTLIWSMNRHLKRVPTSFDDDAEAPRSGTVTSDGAAMTGVIGSDPGEAMRVPDPGEPPRESSG
jgi:hypothetical protein